MLRYRSGMDRHTGRVLTGWAHCAQSVDVIWSTQLDERVMRLAFGSEVVRLIGRGLAPGLLLDLYRELVVSAHRWEPEYRIRQLDVTRIERTGGLAVVSRGYYYPEGRLGNYDAVEAASASYALARAA